MTYQVFKGNKHCFDIDFGEKYEYDDYNLLADMLEDWFGMRPVSDFEYEFSTEASSEFYSENDGKYYMVLINSICEKAIHIEHRNPRYLGWSSACGNADIGYSIKDMVSVLQELIEKPSTGGEDIRPHDCGKLIYETINKQYQIYVGRYDCLLYFFEVLPE